MFLFFRCGHFVLFLLLCVFLADPRVVAPPLSLLCFSGPACLLFSFVCSPRWVFLLFFLLTPLVVLLRVLIVPFSVGCFLADPFVVYRLFFHLRIDLLDRIMFSCTLFFVISLSGVFELG